MCAGSSPTWASRKTGCWPNPLSKLNSDNHINSFRYLPSIVTGTAGVLPFPTARQLQVYDTQATKQLRPVNYETAPPGSPIVPPGAPGGGKIKHVFYLVRENLEGLYVAFEHYIPVGDDPHAVAISSGVNTREGGGGSSAMRSNMR